MTYRVQRSCGHGWEGKADHLPVPAFNTLTPMVHPAAVCWFPWFFTILSHNNKFPTAAFQPQSFNRVNRLLNISVALTLSPYVSLTFLPNVGIEIPEYNCQSVFSLSRPTRVLTSAGNYVSSRTENTQTQQQALSSNHMSHDI